jgi:hypothetical protein
MNLKKKIFLVKFFIIFKIINNGEFILNKLIKAFFKFILLQK